MALLVPDCSKRQTVVPRVLHATSRSQKPPQTVLANSRANPDYVLRYRNPPAAATYVSAKCGKEAAAAYACLASAASRADLYRYCALTAEGGVYVETDIALLTPLEEVYSPCSKATIGRDVPYMNVKKMFTGKIMAAKPNAPLMRCMLDGIIRRVRTRKQVKNARAITGYDLLTQCYKKENGTNADGVALTYKDTYAARWPRSGLRTDKELLAFQTPPGRFKYSSKRVAEAENLFAQGRYYMPLNNSVCREFSKGHLTGKSMTAEVEAKMLEKWNRRQARRRRRSYQNGVRPKDEAPEEVRRVPVAGDPELLSKLKASNGGGEESRRKKEKKRGGNGKGKGHGGIARRLRDFQDAGAQQM